MNGNVIRTITIRGTSEGLDKLQTDLVKLAAAHKGVAIAAEETDKATLSLERAYKQQTLRLDVVARAQNNIARETKIANQMRNEEKISAEQLTERLNLINQHYTKASQGAQTYGKALQQGTGEARLARHEMINLSRQIQDVGVSLASGQAPLTVLVQQGSQIADVFATSSGTIGGFFKQVGAGAAGFLASTAGMATGAAAIGTALVVVGSNYASAQREIQKGLSGIGAASGVTLDQINQIAEATWTWGGASVSQARVAATAFAATGNIYKANVEQATKIIDQHVRAGGDAEEMTKRLAAALEDPAKGALELNKQYGFLNATTLENIRLLQSQGKEQEAQAVLMDKLLPKIQKQAEAVGFWANAWNVAGNAASAYFDDLGKAIARQAERATGSKFLGGFTDEERLGRARERVSGLQATNAPRSAWHAELLKAAQEEVKRLEQALDKGAAAFDKLSVKAQMAADSFMPLQEQIRKTSEDLVNLKKYQENLPTSAGAEAIEAGEIRKQQLEEQNAALVRQNQVTAEIAAKYPQMSIEVAKQLELLNAQLAVAQARTGAEQIIAQQYATQVQLQAQGKTLTEAMALAAGQRAIAEANVTKTINDQIKGLEQQIALSQARIRGTEASVMAEQAYQKAVDAGASSLQAAAIASATRAASAQQKEEEHFNRTGQSTARAVNSLQEYKEVNDKAFMTQARMTDEVDDTGAEIRQNVGYQQQFNSALASGFKTLRQWNEEGVLFPFPSQFGDEKFESSYDPLGTTFQKKGLEDIYGAGNVKAVTQGVGLGQFTTYQPDFDKISERLGALVDSNEDLTKSTDSLNATMQDALSPYYSQDPRTTKLGFRAGVTGNPDWATGAGNTNPLVAILGQGATAPGMADGGSFTVGGGYSANDNAMAVFPVASGEEVIVNRNKGGRGGQVINIDNRIIIQGTVDDNALSQMKVSRYQQAQRIRSTLAS